MENVEFRDGEREVPDHVAVMLRKVETHTMTYAEAMRLTEHLLLKERLNEAQKSLIAAHLRELR